MISDYSRARAQGQLTQCKSTLKNIGMPLQQYSAHQSGRTYSYARTQVPNCYTQGISGDDETTEKAPVILQSGVLPVQDAREINEKYGEELRDRCENLDQIFSETQRHNDDASNERMSGSSFPM